MFVIRLIGEGLRMTWVMVCGLLLLTSFAAVIVLGAASFCVVALGIVMAVEHANAVWLLMAAFGVGALGLWARALEWIAHRFNS